MKRKRVKRSRLRAAIKASGFGSSLRLAKRAGVSHTTITRLSKGGTRAANPRTLERIAKALQVSDDWLTGERKSLPYVAEWHRFKRDRRAPGKRKGPTARIRMGGPQIPSLWEVPTSEDVRHSWLLQRVEAAVRHDLQEWYTEEEDARDAYDSWGHAVLGVFVELSSSLLWRVAILQPSLVGGSGDVWRDSDDSLSQNWLLHILEPWFAGTAYLNADVLRNLCKRLLGNSKRDLFKSDSDADMLRALKRYADDCKEYAPAGARFDTSLVRRIGRRDRGRGSRHR